VPPCSRRPLWSAISHQPNRACNQVVQLADSVRSILQSTLSAATPARTTVSRARLTASARRGPQYAADRLTLLPRCATSFLGGCGPPLVLHQRGQVQRRQPPVRNTSFSLCLSQLALTAMTAFPTGPTRAATLPPSAASASTSTSLTHQHLPSAASSSADHIAFVFRLLQHGAVRQGLPGLRARVDRPQGKRVSAERVAKPPPEGRHARGTVRRAGRSAAVPDGFRIHTPSSIAATVYSKSFASCRDGLRNWRMPRLV
jgi:hypothetical protein